MQHPQNISIADYNYELPDEKIALYPLQARDESKLLIYKNQTISEDSFKHIDAFLEENSLLVFNNTKVIRARLIFFNSKHQAIEIFCLEPHQQLTPDQAMAAEGQVQWNCLVGNLKRWKDEELCLSKNGITLFAKIAARTEQHVTIAFSWQAPAVHFSEVLQNFGHTPIPPYLKRKSETVDTDRYQTVYARNEGSVAAPTAGLHFTPHILKKIGDKAIRSLQVTLHVGAGTFKPVKTNSLSGHHMHAEWIDVHRETISALMTCGEKKIIAVGTTSLRTIETLYWMGLKAKLNPECTLQELEIKQWEVYTLNDRKISPEKSLESLLSWMDFHKSERLICQTQILIAPPYTLKIAQGLVTNFHQPQSTLLLLISAIVGDKWREIYQHALDHGFRFLSYGDSSLLLK